MAVHCTTTYIDAGLSASSVHASDKSGSTGLACCSAAIEVSAKQVKKKVRRGKRRKKRNGHIVDNGNCNILYANINGFKSKADSVNQIVVEQNIDILLLCETKVYMNSAVQIDGFQSFPVVRQKNNGGGL